jgi:hypothetical protein
LASTKIRWKREAGIDILDDWFALKQISAPGYKCRCVSAQRMRMKHERNVRRSLKPEAGLKDSRTERTLDNT